MNNIKNNILILFFLLLASTRLLAQNTSDTLSKPTDSLSKPIVNPIPTKPIVVKPKPKGPKPLHRELCIGAELNSNGWGIMIDRNTLKSAEVKQSDMFYHFNIWELSFDETKDPRENKTSTTDASGKSTSFIYGKINNFYSLKLGIGGTKIISGKPETGTVAIHWIFSGGFSAGLLKPYYINADFNGVIQPIKYTDDTKDAFLDMNGITGNTGFSKGLSEIKLVPGIFVKTGIHFDFAKNRKNVFAAELGMRAEYYTDNIQIMALQTGTPYFYNLYVALQFGKRW